jgi:predicted anti-sigma-YlaC factor YlaD
MSTVKHEHGPADPLPPEACLEVFEKLSEYLDGELSSQDCAQIQEHIKDCEPCVAFVDSLKKSIQASHELRPHEPVHELPEETRERLKAAWKAALQRRTG